MNDEWMPGYHIVIATKDIKQGEEIFQNRYEHAEEKGKLADFKTMYRSWTNETNLAFKNAKERAYGFTRDYNFDQWAGKHNGCDCAEC